jgi:hypothetical protein
VSSKGLAKGEIKVTVSSDFLIISNRKTVDSTKNVVKTKKKIIRNFDLDFGDEEVCLV